VAADASPDGERVAILYVEEGDDVEAGALLAELGNGALRKSELNEAIRSQAVAEARLIRTRAGEDRNRRNAIRAELEATEERLQIASREMQRADQLIGKGGVTEEEAERRRSTVNVAQLEVVRLTALVAESEEVRGEDVALRRSELEEAAAHAESARIRLDMTRILAPRAGRVLKISARKGERIGDEGLLEIGDVRQMEVVAEVYEADLPSIRIGQPVEVTVKSTSLNLKGEVVQIGQRIGRRIVLDNDPVADADARVAEVRIRLVSESSRLVEGLTNARVDVLIDVSASAP
jgi:HlyD family secretion protein